MHLRCNLQHYNYYRDYDPATGRYVQTDPIGLIDSFSLYAYVGGDPVSGRDPLGLFTYGDVAGAYAHYCKGSETPWSVAFTSLNWAIDPVSLSKKYVEAFAKGVGGPCRDMTFPITYQTGIDTTGADALLVGRHSIKLTGMLEVGCDCSWSFQGSVGSALGHEYYNFNRSNRSRIKEVLTTVGRNACRSEPVRNSVCTEPVD